MAVSSKTIALLVSPFEGGDGPSHSTIELIWASAGAERYLPSEGNKVSRVLRGLKLLQNAAADPFHPGNASARRQLEEVVAELATRLTTADPSNADAVDAALTRDGIKRHVDGAEPGDAPADRLALHLETLFGKRSALKTAKNHYEQATRAFQRRDWEAANAQFRSACDATFDALAHSKGCPLKKTGGNARQWLESEGQLRNDEGDLVRAFMAFAGRSGSHAGISDETDAQLRRHFATALIVFAIAKLG